MAEQNKTVMIAAIVALVLAVVGLGGWYFLSDPAAPPQTAIEPPRPAPRPPAETKPEKKKKKRGGRKKTRGEDQADTKIDRSIRDKTAEEMTPEEIKKRRGDTTKPRGAMP